MGRIVFITGGARSGKSSYALRLAAGLKGRKIFIATLEPLDKEMRKRILLHKKQRGRDWSTVEEPLRITDRIMESDSDVLLIDCLTLWLSNVLCRGLKAGAEINSLIKSLRASRKGKKKIIIVSNEVGMGIVPESPLARRFRDMAGILNQKVSSIADEVYMMVSGVPLNLKKGGL